MGSSSFQKYLGLNYKSRKLTRTVKVDENPFGRRIKHYRGDSNRGLKVTYYEILVLTTDVCRQIETREKETLRNFKNYCTILLTGMILLTQIRMLGMMERRVIRSSFLQLEST